MVGLWFLAPAIEVRILVGQRWTEAANLFSLSFTHTECGLRGKSSHDFPPSTSYRGSNPCRVAREN
jgi:hypothetical protein